MGAVCFEQVRFSGIMFLDDAELDGAPTVRLALHSAPSGDRQIAISSRREASAWDNHATMTLAIENTSAQGRAPAEDRLKRAAVQSRCTSHVEAAAFYASTGNGYQGEFRAMSEAWASGRSEVSAAILVMIMFRREA